MNFKNPRILIVLFFVGLVWSGFAPHDRFTWFLEVVPALIGLPILIFTYPRFKFSYLVYVLLLMHALILMVGGKYTYAEVPFGYWLKGIFGLSRNPYDRIGHFAQGFVPALMAREILVRTKVIKPGKWLFFITCCICLAISACYEFFEWWTAVFTGTKADAFLGTQGDPWDTQWDMFTALIGSIVAQISLSRWQARQWTASETKSKRAK